VNRTFGPFVITHHKRPESPFPTEAEQYAEKRRFFTSYMDKHYRKILSNYPYYTKAMIEILDEMETNHICLNSPDLMDFADEGKKDYLGKKLFDRARDLYKVIKSEIREWT